MRSIGCNTSGCGRKIPQKLTRSLSTPMTDAKSLLVCILRSRPLNLLVLATMSMASLLHSEGADGVLETSRGSPTTRMLACSGCVYDAYLNTTYYFPNAIVHRGTEGMLGSNARRFKNSRCR